MLSVSDVTLRIGQLMHEPYAGLLSGMIFGSKETMSDRLYDALVTTGTLHIVALSGTNIAILTDLVARTCGLFFSRKATGLLTISIIIGFIWFVGPSPSVVRAAIMGSLTIMSAVYGRQIWALWSWFITVTVMLVYLPELLADVSFQLSAGATLGLILFTGQPYRPYRPQVWYQTVKDLICRSLHTTMAAQVFTVPIVFFTFRRFSLISPLSNLLIGFALPWVTAGGIAVVLLSFAFPLLSQLAAYIVWVPLWYIVEVVYLTSGIPFAGINW